MKPLRILLTAAFLLATAAIVRARAMESWSYQQLLDKSDLVVIATPSTTNDTKEHIDLPGFVEQPVIGVETKFRVSAVLKGDKALKDLVLHHYRANAVELINGPALVSFDPTKKRSFLIFLIREADGRYAPTSGAQRNRSFILQTPAFTE
jgi:hypothetical protein